MISGAFLFSRAPLRHPNLEPHRIKAIDEDQVEAVERPKVAKTPSGLKVVAPRRATA
jgi:hypothetical protein